MISHSPTPTEATLRTSEEIEITVVMPCLNEEETIEKCIATAQQTLRENGIVGEVVIADNGSTDASLDIAQRLGARVIHISAKGYGNAVMGGVAAAQGKYVLMGDADGSYDFRHIPRFLEKLRAGYDLVMGNRFQGGIQPGAMPPLHRYFGNPLLSSLGRLFFHSPCGDFHCGIRAFRRDAILGLDLRTTSWEFANEMVVSATLHNLRITEVPTSLAPDGRSRPPHLRSWHAGWRNLRFLLMYSPQWLFLYPGLFLIATGVAIMVWLFPGPRRLGQLELDTNTLVYAVLLVLVGIQSVFFAVLGKYYAVTHGLAPWTPRVERFMRRITLETGLIVGAVLIVCGLGGSLVAVGIWSNTSFGPLDPVKTMRLVLPSALAIAVGCQIVLFSFFLSILGLKHK